VGIRKRWEAGVADARRVLKAAPWEADVDPIEGFYLHELKRETMDEPASPIAQLQMAAK
jgi:NTE family protein